jgi:CRP/FNR family cyclic AMP-dependent transcriptional regulator
LVTTAPRPPQASLETELAALATAMAGVEYKRFEKAEMLYRQDDLASCMFYIREGRVRIYMLSAEGKEKTTLFAGPGDMLGDVSFYLEERHLAYAEAFSPVVEVYQIDHEALGPLLSTSSDLANALLVNLSVRTRRVAEELASQTFLDMRGQIQVTLVQLAGQYGIVTPDGVAIDMHLTHEELAKLVGGNRARVSMCLSQLQRDGFYRVIRGRIVLAPWAAGQLLPP